ncbi:MAG: hypothetical protein HOP03_17175 [Lysobacter sp.]|nr:hypothetical protein [Lysobacter sp.]
MILFFALVFVALAIAGATAFVIFWPLALVHLRDRQPDMLAALSSPRFIHPVTLWWLLDGGYRSAKDRNLDGLATPARLSLATILIGLFTAGILWLWSVASP